MKKPISVMVWIGMTKYGLTKPYFVNEGKFNLNIFELELNKILKKR